MSASEVYSYRHSVILFHGCPSSHDFGQWRSLSMPLWLHGTLRQEFALSVVRRHDG